MGFAFFKPAIAVFYGSPGYWIFMKYALAGALGQ